MPTTSHSLDKNPSPSFNSNRTTSLTTQPSYPTQDPALTKVWHSHPATVQASMRSLSRKDYRGDVKKMAPHCLTFHTRQSTPSDRS